MKLRGMHLPSTRFWDEWGFVDKETGSAKRHWLVIDAPGPWRTGPFVLKEGVSVLDRRDLKVVLEPNPTYWNPDRKPQARIVFDNAIAGNDAIRSVESGDGKVDIVMHLTLDEARAFDGGAHGRLVQRRAQTVLAGIFNFAKAGAPWENLELRRALNMAIDREMVLKDGAGG